MRAWVVCQFQFIFPTVLYFYANVSYLVNRVCRIFSFFEVAVEMPIVDKHFERFRVYVTSKMFQCLDYSEFL